MMLKVLRCVCTSTTSACKPLSFWSWLSVSVCSDAAWAVPATSSAANGAMSSPFNIVSPSVDVLLLGTSWGCTHGPDNYTGGRQGGAQDGRGAGERATARQLAVDPELTSRAVARGLGRTLLRVRSEPDPGTSRPTSRALWPHPRSSRPLGAPSIPQCPSSRRS